MFISERNAHYKNITIDVSIDPELLPHLDCDDKLSVNRTISINLYDLIYSIGTLKSRLFAPSNKQKFSDKADLIEKIYSDTTDFRVRIQEIRRRLGSEDLKSISEDFGIGVSVIIAKSLFNIKTSTIVKIIGNDKRPDWTCQTNDNRVLIVESKGSTNKMTSRAQLVNAIVQKRRRIGDVRIASVTLLQEGQSSSNRFIDPPINSDNMDPSMQNRILRAGHYSSVFSFLGHSVLSRYYGQMRKRLIGSINSNEQKRKNIIYHEIRDEYPKVHFNNRIYAGTFYKINNEQYTFLGIDKYLLSYEDFLNFSDYDDGADEMIEKNHYILQKDGVLIIEINNIEYFRNITLIENIRHYQDYNTITDIDEMTLISFRKYIIYLFDRAGAQVLFSVDDGSLVVVYNDKMYLLVLKLFKSKKAEAKSINTIEEFLRKDRTEGIILITNASINGEIDKISNYTVIIERNKLKEIIQNNDILLNVLG